MRPRDSFPALFSNARRLSLAGYKVKMSFLIYVKRKEKELNFFNGCNRLKISPVCCLPLRSF